MKNSWVNMGDCPRAEELAVSTDMDGLGAELVRLVTPIVEQARAGERRVTAELVITRITTEVGQALERVRAEFASPTKPAVLFDKQINADDPIRMLGLPRSVELYLQRYGQFETIGQLRDAGDWDLRVRNVGPVTLAKIDARLDAAGFPRPLRGQGTRAER